MTLEFVSQPVVAAALGAMAVVVLTMLLRWPMGHRATHRLEDLARGQQQLAGALAQIAEAQIAAQGRLADRVESRLGRAEARMGASLEASAARTGERLGRLSARLGSLDALGAEVAGLQAVLSNKQARGAFGEIQLMEIVANALPPNAYTAQATLSNGRRADCLIHLPHPPGPIAVDAKFPLEAYQAVAAAESEGDRRRARAALKSALQGHIRDISERYLIEGETADNALMFVPSEAVFAEVHGRFLDVVQAGFAARVWIVSPTTLMAVLTAMRGLLRDAQVGAEAARIRAELAGVAREVRRIGEEAARLERHLGLALGAAERAGARAARAGRRADRLEALDFAGEDAPPPVPRAAE